MGKCVDSEALRVSGLAVNVHMVRLKCCMVGGQDRCGGLIVDGIGYTHDDVLSFTKGFIVPALMQALDVLNLKLSTILTVDFAKDG